MWKSSYTHWSITVIACLIIQYKAIGVRSKLTLTKLLFMLCSPAHYSYKGSGTPLCYAIALLLKKIKVCLCGCNIQSQTTFNTSATEKKTISSYYYDDVVNINNFIHILKKK